MPEIVVIQAPFNAPVRTIVLPSPIFGNTEGLGIKVNHQQAMDGTNYTYVRIKNPGEFILQVQWNNIVHSKIDELWEFLENHVTDWWKFFDWRSILWKVKLITNPVNVVTPRRAYPGYIDPTGIRTESMDFSMELRGQKIG